MLATIKAEVCIDEARVYATGCSNGAMFAYTLAYAMPRGTFAGMVIYYGLLLRNMFQLPVEGFPLLHVAGLKDEVIPPKGEKGGDYYYHSLDETLAAWAKNNGCSNPDQGPSEPMPTPWDKLSMPHHCAGFTGCRAGKSVKRCIFPNEGHYFWPHTGDGSPWGEEFTWWFLTGGGPVPPGDVDSLG
jgi:polyhydroxybutyrate depolymerase